MAESVAVVAAMTNVTEMIVVWHAWQLVATEQQ